MLKSKVLLDYLRSTGAELQVSYQGSKWLVVIHSSAGNRSTTARFTGSRLDSPSLEKEIERHCESVVGPHQAIGQYFDEPVKSLEGYSLAQIASIIEVDWKNPSRHVQRHIDAFSKLSVIAPQDVSYAQSTMNLFLLDSGSWTGDVATVVKTELKRRLALADSFDEPKPVTKKRKK